MLIGELDAKGPDALGIRYYSRQQLSCPTSISIINSTFLFSVFSSVDERPITTVGLFWVQMFLVEAE